MNSPLLSIHQIKKSYQQDKTVLRPFDLDIAENEIFFLLGPSGCGKSTLLRIIAGLLDADSGECFLRGQKIDNLPPEKRRMSMVFQNYALWPHFNVFDNIAFGMKMAKIPKTQIAEEVAQLLKLVQLEGFEKRLTTELSGGQQQRVALARALAVKPNLLLLDEPLSNLDSKLRDTMRVEIRRILKNRKVSAIYVTHDRTEALSVADRIGIMKDGKIVQCGTPRELYFKPQSAFTAEFLGGINFFEAVVSGIENNYYTLQCGNCVWHAPCNEYSGANINDTVIAAVREEHFKLDKINNPADFNSIPATVQEVTFMGDHTEYQLTGTTGKIRARSTENIIATPGDEIIMHVPKQNTMVLEKK